MDNDISICIGLYIHAMKKARICNESAISDVDGLTSFLYDRVIGNNPLRKQQLPLLELLQQTVIEFKRQQAEGVVKIDSFVFKPFESRELFDSFQKLLQIIAKYDDGDETDSSLSELLDKLRLLNPTTSEGDTLLHEAVDRNPLHIPPCPSAVKMLLNAGFSANATNDNGDTPLHRAITFSPIDDIHLLVLQALFNGGAHYDFVNKDGKRPMDLAQTDEARMILLEGRTIELKCISARAVKKFGIPYLGVVPKTLEKYISMH
ncbi:Protein fem-1 B [Porites harrisoni]